MKCLMKIFKIASKIVFIGIIKNHEKLNNSDVLPYCACVMGPFLVVGSFFPCNFAMFSKM